MGKGEEYYNKQHLTQTELLANRVYQLYMQAVSDAVLLALSVKGDLTKPFSFSRYPGLVRRINGVLAKLSNDIISVIETGTASEWMLSEQKNNDLVRKLFGKDMPKALEDRFLARNLEGLRTFQKRKSDGMNLSDRVWKYNTNLRSELEMAIDAGLIDGRSGSSLATQVKKYLNEPDKLFRRVRDERGILHLSKNAKNYHPGQGVCRSSYKNAMRMARTEVNIAYRTADHERWSDLDFVVGYEIRRSNRLTSCDVCSSLIGKYPKTFKFRGFHPQCLCVAIPILATKTEMEKLTQMILDGDESDFSSKNAVKKMPDNYNDWMKQNNQRLLNASSTPYFVKDNYKGGDLAKGLKFVA